MSVPRVLAGILRARLAAKARRVINAVPTTSTAKRRKVPL
jgi:hypothetical protein